MIDDEKIDLIISNRLNGYLEAASEQYPVVGEMFREMPTIQPVMMSVAAKGIEWYLQSLWHDAKEEPRNKASVLVIGGDNDDIVYFLGSDYQDWNHEVELWDIDKWCYLSDILPTEKGGEE